MKEGRTPFPHQIAAEVLQWSREIMVAGGLGRLVIWALILPGQVMAEGRGGVGREVSQR